MNNFKKWKQYLNNNRRLNISGNDTFIFFIIKELISKQNILNNTLFKII